MKKDIKHLSENQLWDLSEIFNVVVLKSSRYRHIINQKFIIFILIINAIFAGLKKYIKIPEMPKNLLNTE